MYDPAVIDAVAWALFADQDATYLAGVHVPDEQERELAALLVKSLRTRGFDVTQWNDPSVLDFICPRCGALPDQTCTSASGGRLSRLNSHSERFGVVVAQREMTPPLEDPQPYHPDAASVVQFGVMQPSGGVDIINPESAREGYMSPAEYATVRAQAIGGTVVRRVRTVTFSPWEPYTLPDKPTCP